MTVQVQRRGAVSTIVLDRPQAMNAVNVELADALKQAVEEAAGDASVRAVVLTGNGKAFCSGADLKSGFEPAEDGFPDVGSALRDRFHPIIEGLRTMPKPTIASINGPAVGIGLSFALACDLSIAAESSYLMLAFVNIGLVPDGGSSFLIPERVGLARAMEMAMLGEKVPARLAQQWGLINRVVEDYALKARTEELADGLANGPTRSYAGSKRQLNAWIYRGMEDQLELEASVQQEMAGSGDFMEGVQAFLGKRPPEFKGS